MSKVNPSTLSLSKVIVVLKEKFPDLNYSLLPSLSINVDETIKDPKITLKDLNVSIRQMNMPILEPFKKAMESLLETRKNELEVQKLEKKEKKKQIAENLVMLDDEEEPLEDGQANLETSISKMIEEIENSDVDDPPIQSDLAKMGEIIPELKKNKKRKVVERASDSENDNEDASCSSKKKKKKAKKGKTVSFCDQLISDLDSDCSYKSLDADEFVLNFKKNNVKWWKPYVMDKKSGGIVPMCHCKKRCQKKVSIFSKEKELMCRGDRKKKCDMRFNQKTFYKFVKFLRKADLKTFPIPKCSCKDLVEDSSVIVKGSSERSPNLSFWYFCNNCRNITYLNKVWPEIEKIKHLQKDDSESSESEDN